MNFRNKSFDTARNTLKAAEFEYRIVFIGISGFFNRISPKS